VARCRHFVGTTEHDVLSRRLYSATLEEISQPHAGEARVADCALAPLHARHFRIMQAATVARALQGIYDRMLLKLRQFCERNGVRLLDLATDG